MPQGGFEGTFRSYDELKKIVLKADKVSDRQGDRLAAIIFMRRDQKFTQAVVGSLDYFDKRTGETLDFFLAGWRKTREWLFDEGRFIEAKTVIEQESDWTYDGGVWLLIFATRNKTREDVVVDLSNIIAIRLDRLEELKTGDGLDEIIERLCNFVQNYEGTNPLVGFRNQEWRVSVYEGLINSLPGLLPEGARRKFQYLSEFGIRDVSRKNRRNEVAAEMKKIVRVYDDLP